ncbi:MAG: hypothetical protein ACREA2_02710 [Blastocatellia bacterium]
MKLDIKPSTALVVGGITLAGAFLVTAIVSPESLDGILHPSDERSASMKKEMERQKGIDADGRSDARPGPGGETKSGPITPTPLPEETAPGWEGKAQGDERIPKPECISRNQVVNIIGASEEAREGRVIGISVTPDGGRIMVAYRKKTFMGIGSGENQIEGILQRGLRNRFPDRLIKSVKVRSDGNRSVRRGSQNVNVEVLVVETLQTGCRWP